MSSGAKIFLGGLVLLFVVMLFWLVSGYNYARRMDEEVNKQWAEIENHLKRRYDLIPNLVNTVKGYAKHEKELFSNIAEARKAYFTGGSQATRAKAAGKIEGFLSRLLMLQERYPNLKANQNFLKLQDSLEGTENRIATARTRYNESVKALNAYARSFFGQMICSWAGVQKREYFEIERPEERENPTVDFSE